MMSIILGDTFCYDVESHQDRAARETEAANCLFGLLPEAQRVELTALWEEFEARQTAATQFATALDRLQPLLHKQQTSGGTWRIHGITRDRVLQRVSPMAEGVPGLWPLVDSIIEDCVQAGYLKVNSEQ